MALNKRKTGLAAFFLCLLGIAHVLLPYLEQENVGPFYRWDLFSSADEPSRVDLEIVVNGQTYFLTDSIPGYDSNEQRIQLWNFAVEIAKSLGEPAVIEERMRRIEALLAKDNIQLKEICRIKKPMTVYLLLSHSEKREACEALSF